MLSEQSESCITGSLQQASSQMGSNYTDRATVKVNELITKSNITTRQQEIIRAIKRGDIQMLLDLHIFEEGDEGSHGACDFTFTPEGMTPLMFACAQGDLNIVNLILSAPGVNIHSLDKQGFNCLYYATYYGHIEVLEKLKQMQVDYKKANNGTSCLHIAVKKGHMSVIDFLLTRTDLIKAKETMKKKLGERRATIAVDPLLQQKGDYLINKAVVWEKQVDIDEQKGEDGVTAVFLAIRFDNLPVLKQLRMYGADFNIECKIGDSQKMRPIQLAAKRGNTKIFEFVLSCNEDQMKAQCTCQLSNSFSQPIHLVAYNGNIEILQILLRNGAQILAKNRFGDTCLHIAIRNKQIAFIRWVINYLVQNKYFRDSVEVENSTEHLTPYMLAVLREQFEVADWLQASKFANRDYVNVEGLTLHQLATNLHRVRVLDYLAGKISKYGIGAQKRNSGSMDTIARVKENNTLPTSPTIQKKDPSKFGQRNQSVPTGQQYQEKTDIFQKSFNNSNIETDVKLPSTSGAQHYTNPNASKAMHQGKNTYAEQRQYQSSQIGGGGIRSDQSIPKFESAMGNEFPVMSSREQQSNGNASLGEISARSPNAQFEHFNDSKSAKKSSALNQSRMSEEYKNPMLKPKRTIQQINGLSASSSKPSSKQTPEIKKRVPPKIEDDDLNKPIQEFIKQKRNK